MKSFSFSKDTVGFLLEGEITEAIIENLNNAIADKLLVYGKINLYLEDTNIDSFSLTAIINQIQFKFKNSNRFHKIALVTDRKWIQLCGSIDNLFMDGIVKSFNTDDRLEAITWIAEDLSI